MSLSVWPVHKFQAFFFAHCQALMMNYDSDFGLTIITLVTNQLDHYYKQVFDLFQAFSGFEPSF